MKRVLYLSIKMLLLMMLPLMVACGSDDDNGNDGTAAAYTEEEIMSILKGGWDVSGNLTVTYNSTEFGEDIYDNYEAYIEFDPFNSNARAYFFEVKKGDVIIKASGYSYHPERLYVYESMAKGNGYKFLRKNEKCYINFTKTEPYNFEIQSLTKKSFRLVLDEDINEGGKVIGHVHMTLNSK